MGVQEGSQGEEEGEADESPADPVQVEALAMREFHGPEKTDTWQYSGSEPQP